MKPKKEIKPFLYFLTRFCGLHYMLIIKIFSYFQLVTKRCVRPRLFLIFTGLFLLTGSEMNAENNYFFYLGMPPVLKESRNRKVGIGKSESLKTRSPLAYRVREPAVYGSLQCTGYSVKLIYLFYFYLDRYDF